MSMLPENTTAARPIFGRRARHVFAFRENTAENCAAPAAENARLDSIQYMRALAAWLVVAFHVTATHASMTGSVSVFGLGAVGVDIFFVLSGFLMAMLAERSAIPAGLFLWRRFARIAPLYYILTLALFAIAFFAPFLLRGTVADWQQLFFSLLFLPNPAGYTGPILTVGWTLNYEFFFYVLVVISCGLFRDRTLMTTAIALCCFVAAGQVMSPQTPWVAFYTDDILLEFVFGILAYRYIYLRFDGSARHMGLLCMACLAAAVFLLLGPGSGAHPSRAFLWGLPATALTISAIMLLRFNSAPLRWIGDWSFSTYLLHVYVIQFWLRFMAEPAVAGQGVAMVDWIGIIATTLAGSALLFRLVEQPSLRALNRLTAARA